jgi:hypothetical protein
MQSHGSLNPETGTINECEFILSHRTSLVGQQLADTPQLDGDDSRQAFLLYGWKIAISSMWFRNSGRTLACKM